MRKYYLDNLRWLTVGLVLVYHVFYLFNGVGVLGGIGSFSPIQYQDAFLYLVYPWFMVLLFLIAGMSTRYALTTRSPKQFFRERTLKLLVPSTLGLLVFQWLVGYLNLTIGSALETIPTFMRYPLMVLTGTGPLWFIQMLWLFSILLLLIRKIDKNERLYHLGEKCNTAVLLLLFLPVWGASQLFNPPMITTYRFGIYFFVFLLGYFVFSHDVIMDKIERIHIPALITAILLAIGYVWYFFGTNYAADACLTHIFTNIYLWIAVIAILGCGKAWLNRTSPFAAYMSKASFGIYIVHYIVALSVCYLLKSYLMLPAAASYPIALAAVLLLSPLLYEVIRRIPIIRFLVLGMKK